MIVNENVTMIVNSSSTFFFTIPFVTLENLTDPINSSAS